MPNSDKTHIDEERLQARTQDNCYVCGQGNQRGLRIHFTSESSGTVTALWRPESDFEGFCGIVHGGVVSTVLDEVMSKAVAATETQALTAELKVRFRQHVAVGESFTVRGWMVRRTKRIIETEAALLAANGREHAHAWAKFLSLL